MARRPSLPRSVKPQVRRAIDALSADAGGILSDNSAATAGEEPLAPGVTGKDYVPIPGPPRNLQAFGGFSSVLLTWDPPGTSGVSHFEIFRCETDDLTLAAGRGPVGASLGYSYADTPPAGGLGESFFYWVRAVNREGKAGPFNAAAGTPVATAADPEYVLAALGNKIKALHLHQSLGERIDKIDTPTTGLLDRVSVLREQVQTPTTGLLSRVSNIQSEIETINAVLADISQTPPYDNEQTYQPGALVTFDGGLYRALVETTGNAPSSAEHWEKIGDYASLGEAVAGLAFKMDDVRTRLADTEDGLEAEIIDRETLAALINDPETGLTAAFGAIDEERGLRVSAIEAEAYERGLLASQVNDPQTGLPGAFSAIQQESQTRASQTESLAAQQQTLSAGLADTEELYELVRLGTDVLFQANRVLNYALIDEERSARATDIDAEAQARTALVAALLGDGEHPGSLALLEEALRTYADSESAVAQKVGEWIAAHGENFGLLEQKLRTYADSEGAFSEFEAALVAAHGENLSGLIDSLKTYADEDKASAEALLLLETKIDDPETGLPSRATVQQVSQAVSAGVESAKAQAVQQVETELGRDYAAVRQTMESADGLTAQWEAKGSVGELTGGIGFFNDGTDVVLGIHASKFYLADPTQDNENVLPMVYGTFELPDGTQRTGFWISGAHIVDLTAKNFVAQQIIADTVRVTAELIADQIKSGTLRGVRVISEDPGDPTTYSQLDGGELVFYRQGVLHKYLKQVLSGTALSGTQVTLTGLDRAPEVMVSLRDLTSYLPAFASQAQRWEVRHGGITDLGSGSYRFTPVAVLKLAANSSNVPIGRSQSLSGNYVASSPFWTTPANTQTITALGTVNSRRGTGQDVTWHRRQCTIRLHYRLAGSGGSYVIGATQTVDHGPNFNASNYAISAAGLAPASYEFYLSFVWSDTGQTFTSGTPGGYWERATDTRGGTGASASVFNNTTSPATDNKNIVFDGYSLPSGWELDNDNGPAITKTATYSYNLSRSSATLSGSAQAFGPGLNHTISGGTTSASASNQTATFTQTSYTTSHGIMAHTTGNSGGASNSASVSYSNLSATIKRKRWVEGVTPTTAVNDYTISHADVDLSQSEIIDNTGIVNWIAIA